MYRVVKKEWLNNSICSMEIEHPLLAEKAKPGQFLIVKIDREGERVPLTICDYDRYKKTIRIVFLVIGESTKIMSELEVGDFFQDIIGPLGKESEFIHEDIESLRDKRYLFVAGGVGAAPIYPQVKWFKENGLKADVIIGAKSKEVLILESELKKVAEKVYIATDDGSYGFHGLVTDLIEELIERKGIVYDHVVAIGPMMMMKYVSLKTKKYSLPTTVSLNPIMIDGTGMCGACRVTVGDEVKFACVDGPEFDGHLIDFDESIRRQNIYRTEEGKSYLKMLEGSTHHSSQCKIHLSEEKEKKSFDRLKKIKIREQSPQERVKNFDEVTLNYTLNEAELEASRCINCKNPRCVEGCPISINIPEFISHIKNGELKKAAKNIRKYTNLPSICGRVCPQEDQCEKNCVLGIKGEAVAIGKLEKFIGDYILENGLESEKIKRNGDRVAIVGSGPAGLSAAGELGRKGYDVVVFESLHELGGVLTYGIPNFRLPKDTVVKKEIESLKDLGVVFEKNVIIGRSITIDELFEKGFKGVFIGSGAGLPNFMKIPGENLNGVFSANEFLTRVNLMKAYEKEYKTPIKIPKKIAVIGGGNVAMDAVRTAIRLGAESHIVYRRGVKEFPARVEEVHHAIEEGVIIDELTLPKEILGDEKGEVIGLKCIRTKLGEKDETGRARFIEIEGSEFNMDVDTVIMAIGTSPNPLISSLTKDLEINKWKCLVVDEKGKTTKEGVFAGGDAVSGAATVILAMEAGKKAAQEIDRYIKVNNI